MTKRARKIPIQVYVSEHEHAALKQLVQARDVSVSQLVRVWIRRAIAQAPKTPPPPDPRQSVLF